METILVPVDFSKNSLNALKYAEIMARKVNAAIILLHVPALPPPEPDGILSVGKSAEEFLQDLCNGIIDSERIRCSYIISYGDTVATIIKTAESKNVDLIIMGTHGASGLKEMFTGSNTAKVIEGANCPVIAVPENIYLGEIQKITYATDYRESDIEGLHSLTELANAFTAEICIVHIADGEYTSDAEDLFINQFVRKVTSTLGYENISFQVIYGKDVLEKLNELVENRETNLLVMSTRKKNLLGRIFGVSFTRKIVHHLQIPLMAFHRKEEPVYLI